MSQTDDRIASEEITGRDIPQIGSFKPDTSARKDTVKRNRAD